MKLSVIIPAFNEEKLLSGCLHKVDEALRANAASDFTSEVIVVDNNSSDRTAELARASGAGVVFEPINHIARARNAGAAAAGGDWFLFVDADSWLSASTLAALLACIRRGRCAGGGCLVGLDAAPLWGRAMLAAWNFLCRLTSWAAGSFVFCRADLFREVGGFPLDFYATEEIHFSVQLKRVANKHGLKVVILPKQRHVSSGRKFDLYGSGRMLQLMLRILLAPRLLRDPSKLFLHYDGKR